MRVEEREGRVEIGRMVDPLKISRICEAAPLLPCPRPQKEGMDIPYENERTPLLQPRIPPLLPFTNSPTPRKPKSHHSKQQRQHSDHHSNATLSISRLVHILAALKQGHLPSTCQTLALSDYLLSSSLLSETDDGTVWEPRYGQGRIGVGRLSREGENVRKGMREWVDSFEGLIKERTGGEESQRDGWQELIWSMRNHRVEIGK